MDDLVTRAGIPKAIDSAETRVPLVPEQVRRAVERLKVSVAIEPGAGEHSRIPDQAYLDAGAEVADARDLWANCDLILTIAQPTVEQIRAMKRGAALLGYIRPYEHHELVRACLDAGVSLMALDQVPRTTRAQAVDVLSAMSNLAGYKAVILAAEHLPRMLPMMMTAAGTIPPTRVFIVGAGVAGLQAIATAKRLGAIVEAYDVRPAVKEQVESLGAKFVEFQLEAKVGQGGYAAEQSAEEQERQRQQMQAVVAAADAVITTALIPGRPAPKLIDERMVHAMKPGSVIVDLAAEAGGNCELTQPGTVAKVGGVTIVGLPNLAATMPFNASSLWSRIVYTLLDWTVKDGQMTLDFDDEIIAGMTVVHGGEIRADKLKAALTQEAGA